MSILPVMPGAATVADQRLRIQLPYYTGASVETPPLIVAIGVKPGQGRHATRRRSLKVRGLIGRGPGRRVQR